MKYLEDRVNKIDNSQKFRNSKDRYSSYEFKDLNSNPFNMEVHESKLRYTSGARSLLEGGSNHRSTHMQVQDDTNKEH